MKEAPAHGAEGRGVWHESGQEGLFPRSSLGALWGLWDPTGLQVGDTTCAALIFRDIPVSISLSVVGFCTMLSTKRQGTSILTIKEILENGFVAGASSHTHSSPVCSYYMDNSSASKPDAWEFLMDLDNATKGSSLCAIKQSESLSSCVKTDLHSLTLGVSDLSFACFCKTHHSQAAFDLSSLPCEHPSRASCLMDVASQNTSTPCKTEKHPKPLESLLSKSIELVGDLSTLGKTPVPKWEISAIKSPLDTSLSLDVSAEELKLLGCSKADVPSLETSVVIPLAWPGAFKRHPALIYRPATPETQPSDLEPVPVFLHQAP